MVLSSLRSIVSSGLERLKESLFLAEEKALESLPEPYIPSVTASSIAESTVAAAKEAVAMPEKLREKAARALHGPDANPSQLGDPVSLKAEGSDSVPKPDEDGAGPTSNSPSNPGSSSSSGSVSERSSTSATSDKHNGTGKDTLREKAVKKLHGEDANPSMLGDPVSLKAEQSQTVPKPDEEGTRKRDSKL